MAVYQGIDPGKTNVRKITIKTGWGTLKTAKSVRPGKKILALPSYLMTFRQFVFPFQDKKRIREVLPGELTESLAYSLDDVVWDISSIDKEKARAIIVPKNHLENFLQTQGNSVQVIDAEPCALVRAANYGGFKDALIIDMGAHKTLAVGIKDGKMDLVRVRLSGGDMLDGVIAREKNVPLAQGSAFKEKQGLNSGIVREFIDHLFDSLNLKSTGDYEMIILTGGCAQMPGLPEYLAETLEKPVNYLTMPEGLSPFHDAVAFGAALYDTVKEENINLKEKKESTKTQPYLVWLYMLIIPILLFSVNLKVKENQLKTEHQQIKNAMVFAYKKNFPRSKRVVSPLSQLKGLMKKKGISESAMGKSTLEILTDIAQARKGKPINFYEMDLDEDGMQLKGETDSFESVDKFRTALQKNFSKADIIEQKTKPGGKVDFQIKLETRKVESKK